jgi:Transposase DDE domain
MSATVEDQMTRSYCFVDDFFKTPPGLAQGRHSPHAHPHFSDAEVLTSALLQGAFEVATRKQTYGLVAQNWRRAFPLWPSDKQWLTRVHPLLPQVGGLWALTCTQAARAARLYLLDSKPIPLCLPIRHGRVRLLRDEGAYFGKTSKGWFFGFKLHLLRHIDGRVLNVVLAPGNYDDRVPALTLVQAVDGGVTLGDLGSRGPECVMALAEEAQMLLITRDQAPTHRVLLSPVRQQVETTFSQLWRKVVDRVFSRSWSGLWNTLQLKVLYSNLRHAGVLSA